jgi:hypothetical protein
MEYIETPKQMENFLVRLRAEREAERLIGDYTRTLKRGLTGGVYALMAIREIVLYSLWCSIDCGFDYFPDMRNQWGVNLDVRHMWVGKHS